MNDKEQLEVAILENIQRENLNPLEEADSYKRLIDEFGHTQEELAEILGKSRSHVANTLRLLSLPENVKEELKNGKLSFGHARALIGVDGAESLAKDIISKYLNVRETENLVRSKKNRNATRSYVDPEVINLAGQISSLIGLDANIKLKGAGGVVEINFNSLEELDSLMKYLHK